MHIIYLVQTRHDIVWLGRIVVRALDLQLEIASTIPATALFSATFGKLFAPFASVTKQYNLIPSKMGTPHET